MKQDKPSQKHLTDEVLGLLAYEDEEWWAATVTVQGRKLGFYIGGDTSPDAGRLAHAREIVGSFADFSSRVGAFLADCAATKDWERYADEILALEIESVALLVPGSANDGMIYFSGRDENRVWRCDYVDGKPVDLGFDS